VIPVVKEVFGMKITRDDLVSMSDLDLYQAKEILQKDIALKTSQLHSLHKEVSNSEEKSYMVSN